MVLTSLNVNKLLIKKKMQTYLTIIIISIQFCNFSAMVVGRIYSNYNLKSLATLIYSIVQLIAVLSFIPSVRYFIFRRQEINNEKKGTFAENKWPWVLVAINIMRNSCLIAVSFTYLVAAQIESSSNLLYALSIADKIVFMLIPTVDLCTGMSILYLYHILGEDKRRKGQLINTNSSNFESLKMDETQEQMRDRVFEIKLRENRSCLHHTSDAHIVVNSDINQSYEQFIENDKEPIKPNLDTI